MTKCAAEEPIKRMPTITIIYSFPLPIISSIYISGELSSAMNRKVQEKYS